MIYRKMLYPIIGFYFTAVWLVLCFADDVEDVLPKADVMSDNEINDYLQEDVVKYIEAFEEFDLRARKSVEEVSQENTLDLYDEMTGIVTGIIDLNANHNNVYKFLYAKGLDRVVAPNLRIPYYSLRRQLLMLTRQLLDIAPTTAKTAMPLSILDNILEIFEHDKNPQAKAYALDVLNVWLPGSPKLQARVMRLKGLDPFYHQISKLDMTVIQTLLELFNKILDEHIAARDASVPMSAQDRKLYQQIGLIERLSTGRVCDGLLNIFEKSLPVLSASGGIVRPMFELIKKIEPFCLKTYKRKNKPLKVFNELLQFFNERRNEKEFGDRGVDVTEIRDILERYIHELKQSATKDEL